MRAEEKRMEEAIPIWVIIVYVLAGIFSIGSTILVMRTIRKNRQYAGDPAKKEIAMGFIQSVTETSWYINNRPQLAFSLMIFPLNEPPRTITVKQVIGYMDIPNMQPGKYVDVSYESGTFKNAHIDGPKPFAVTGVQFDMKFFDGIRENLKPAFAQETQGKIISAQPTGTFVDGLPLYRIRASFYTAEGAAIEGDALRICRPYLVSQLVPGNNAGIMYNKANPDIFSIVE
jgi:hypothetical protein